MLLKERVRPRLRPRSLVRALAGAIVAIVAIGASSALSQYVWCAGAQEIHRSCCCPSVDDHGPALRAPCCEERASIQPEGTQAHESSPRVMAAQPALAVALLALYVDPLHHAVDERVESALARAGPSERVHARNSIYLL